jgi:hypothetical protein
MAISRPRTAALTLGLLLILAPAFASAQTNLGTFRGKVADEQGGVVPGATVTARQVQTNVTRNSVTDSNGQYFIPNLPAGSYELTVELAGFGTARQSELVLRVGLEATVNFVLKLAAVQESVTVSAQATLVETQHTVGLNIDTKQLDALPTFNRNFSDLAQLTPGVTSTGSGSMGFSASGQAQYQNNVFVDGGTNAMQFYGIQADTFPQDWIQEFEVMTNGFSAEFGNASGAVLNVITRSGTNEIHGRAYGFFQNASLNSPPYSGHYTNGAPEFLASTPLYDQYRVGGYTGGPLVKNKAFFFVGFEDLDNSATSTLSISDYWRARGVQSVIPTGYTIRPILLKADWNINDRNRLSVRHDRTNQTLQNCSGQLGVGCNNSPLWTLESRGIYSGPIWSAIGSLTSSFGNRAFNEARVYYGVNKVSIASNLAGKGGQVLLQDTANLGLYSEKTYPGAHFGTGSLGGLEGETNLYFIDNFSYVAGRHQLKIGGQVSRPKFFMDIDASQHGRWNFSTDRAFDINDPSSYPFMYTLTLGIATDIESNWNAAAYVQDTWKAREDLTLNLGVRWDADTSVTNGNQFVDGYNQRFVAAYGGAPPIQKIKASLHDVSPRMGLVWVPAADRRTTVRLSGGTFYDQNHYNYSDILLNQTLLNEGRYVFNANDNSLNPFFNPADPNGSRVVLRAFLASNFPNSPNLAAVGKLPQVANGLDPNFRSPYTLQITGGMTHQFASNIYVQADYVASRGKDQIIQQQTNLQLVNGLYVTNDPRYSQFTLYQNIGWTRYDALQTRVQHTGSRLRLGVSYTLAKTTSDVTANGPSGGLATNPFDLSIDVGPANNDRRHNVSLDGSYNLPLDIQASGLFHYGSPLPWSVTSVTVVRARPEPRNNRRGDDFKQTDIRLSKAFKLRGHLTATGFWEAFNVFNNDNFYNFQASLQSSAFGLPQSEFSKRAQQFGFRLDF